MGKRLRSAIAVLLTMGCGTTTWASGILDGSVIVNTGAADSVYATGDWSGAVFNLAQGGSFLLGGQVETWNSGTMYDSIDAVRMLYSLNGAAAQSIWLSWTPTVIAVGNTLWQGLPSVNLATGLTAGSNTLNVRFEGLNAWGPNTYWLDNGGAGWTATLNVQSPVPEPSSLALLLGGLVVLGAARPRRSV